MENNDKIFIKRTIELAKRAAATDEVPVGALITYENEVIAEAFNQKESKKNPLLHAEIIAIEKASQRLSSWRLKDCTLYTSLEPCLMCTGALIQARVKRIVFATDDLKGGACGGVLSLHNDKRLNHQIEVSSGLLKEESQKILKDFFYQKRNKKQTTTLKVKEKKQSSAKLT